MTSTRTQPRTAMVRAATALFAVMLPAIFAAGAMWGCAKAGPSPELDDTKTTAVVAMSTDYHKLADIALMEGRRDDAKKHMRELLDETRRFDDPPPPVWDVRFDAATRLANLHQEDGELEAAEQAARDGLRGEEGAPPSLFRGYLHQTLGDILEKRGELRGAVDEHTEAIKIFKQILDADQAGKTEETPP